MSVTTKVTGWSSAMSFPLLEAGEIVVDARLPPRPAGAIALKDVAVEPKAYPLLGRRPLSPPLTARSLERLYDLREHLSHRTKVLEVLGGNLANFAIFVGQWRTVTG
jgi:hypothetical protein